MPVILFLFQNISRTIYWRSLEPQNMLTDVYFYLGSIEQWGFGEDNGTPLQYSCLENPMDGGAW